MNTPLILLPTYNEIENIRLLVPILMDSYSEIEILVIDDNSPDGTAKAVVDMQAKYSRLHLLNRPKKEGLAQAYIAGFKWGLEKNKYSSFIEMDADFSHDSKDLKSFFETLKTYDAVVGCRYISGGGISGWSFIRECISRGGNIYAKLILGLPYKDLTGGFNGWSTKVIQSIGIDQIKSKGYAFQVEMKYRTHKMGFSIKEIPIHFKNRKYGTSKMSSNIIWEAAFRVLQMKRMQLPS
jgi:dolichol-phosphate mannosyltransferase